MKKFWKKASPSSVLGTGWQADLKVDYKKLFDTFGKSHTDDSYKIDAEWDLKFLDGTIATIYNYKDGKNYLGDEGLELEEITDWNIGGVDRKAVFWVKMALQMIDKKEAIKFLFGEAVVL